jgi:hypothetical protein
MYKFQSFQTSIVVILSFEKIQALNIDTWDSTETGLWAGWMKNQCLLPGRNRDFSLLCGIQTSSGSPYSLLSDGYKRGMKLTADLHLVSSLRMHRMVLTYTQELLCQYCHTNIKYSNSLLCPHCSFCFALLYTMYLTSVTWQHLVIGNFLYN